MVFMNVTDKYAWQFTIPRIMFGDEVLCLDCRVVVDSGQSLNSAPEAQIRLINRQFLFAREDEGLFYLNCADKRKGRPIGLVFSEDAQFALDDYFLEADYGAHSVCFSAYTFHKTHHFWVFGVDILQHFFTVFDAEKKRIGFAKRKC
ncbi:cathepsin D [Clonorchis sinensis]|uniref:Cathepsin D n=1 Tax=Clonorchis sinensis TaxID=79923 RepID=G7YJA9_CLOSI|nr:cathepsin D [Clonorchis sinensis]